MRHNTAMTYNRRPTARMQSVEVVSAARECFSNAFILCSPIRKKKKKNKENFVGYVVNLARTAKFGGQYAVTRYVGVTREHIVWLILCSGGSAINTKWYSPPPCLLCQLYVHSNSNYCKCTSANGIPFCFLQYSSDKETGIALSDVPKNNVSTNNLIIINDLNFTNN